MFQLASISCASCDSIALAFTHGVVDRQVTNDIGRFKSTEGLFNLEVWGMDNPPLQKLIQTAVQASPMDTRREMWRCGRTLSDVHRE